MGEQGGGGRGDWALIKPSVKNLINKTNSFCTICGGEYQCTAARYSARPSSTDNNGTVSSNRSVYKINELAIFSQFVPRFPIARALESYEKRTKGKKTAGNNKTNFFRFIFHAGKLFSSDACLPIDYLICNKRRRC